ncbi:MAG: hypothetical protein CSB16_02085 [Clostridiales bacterium]|nr:MAG: hypothetical protein CSB16_02085 [Clostridiales bacterium]
MGQKNLKVVLELRDDLEEKEREEVIAYIEKWKNKFRIEKIDDVTYCRKGDNKNYGDDFGDVTFFFHQMGDVKQYFKKLELIKIQSGKKYVTV